MSDISSELNNKKQRLGRGLGSLLGQAQERTQLPTSIQPSSEASPQVIIPAPVQNIPANDTRVWSVAIEKLQSGEYQPRTHFEKEKIAELAQSIKENGILQPIIARRIDGSKFEIIAGERRWRAAQAAGLKEVPVILKTLKNQEALELSIIENVQREDLNSIEEAEAYNRLSTEFKLTQQQIAEKVGKDRATIANSLRLLNLCAEARKLLIDNKITPGHAKVLLVENDPIKQAQTAKRIIEENLSVRQLEKVIQGKIKENDLNIADKTDPNVTQRLIKGLSEELQKIMGTKVAIDYHNSKGKISIHFYSDEELTQIIDRMKQGCQK